MAENPLTNEITIAGRQYPMWVLAAMPIGAIALLLVARRGGKAATAEIPPEIGTVDTGITALRGLFDQLSSTVDQSLTSLQADFMARLSGISAQTTALEAGQRVGAANVSELQRRAAANEAAIAAMRTQVTTDIAAKVDPLSQRVTAIEAAQRGQSRTAIGLRNVIRWIQNNNSALLASYSPQQQQQQGQAFSASAYQPLITSPQYEAYPTQ